MPQWLIVVQRYERELYKVLRQSFKEDAPVAVIYERRLRERRRGSIAPRGDRRRRDRRQRRPSASLYEVKVLRVDEPQESDATLSGMADAQAGPGAPTKPCPECGLVLEFEMPRFPQPPSRLEVEAIHMVSASGIQHYVDIQAFTASGRPLLVQRSPVRRHGAGQ